MSQPAISPSHCETDLCHSQPSHHLPLKRRCEEIPQFNKTSSTSHRLSCLPSTPLPINMAALSPDFRRARFYASRRRHQQGTLTSVLSLLFTLALTTPTLVHSAFKPFHPLAAQLVERSARSSSSSNSSKVMEVLFVVCWLLNVPATCESILGTDLLRQFYLLPH